MNRQYTVEDILSIAVLYNSNIEECDTLITLDKCAAKAGAKLDVLLYDNSKISQDSASCIKFPNLRCTYYHDPTNPGVSKAYNYGASAAGKMNKAFILLVDQDTHFPVEAINRYLEAANSFPGQYLFCPILQTSRGIYSPTKYYFRRGAIWADATPGLHSLKNRNILNSGLMVNLEFYQQVGGYNEKIELYFSDFDFVNRCRKLHKDMVVVDVTCFHSLSDIDNVDIGSAVRRFRQYVKGSYYSISTATDYLYLFITIMLRSFKLSWQYKTGKFMQIFFKQYLVERTR